MGDKEYGTMSVTEQLNREIDRLKAELEESRAQLVGWPDLFDENMRLSTELAEARAENEELKNKLADYKFEVAAQSAICDRQNGETFAEAMQRNRDSLRQEAARECLEIVLNDELAHRTKSIENRIKSKFELEG